MQHTFMIGALRFPPSREGRVYLAHHLDQRGEMFLVRYKDYNSKISPFRCAPVDKTILSEDLRSLKLINFTVKLRKSIVLHA